MMNESTKRFCVDCKATKTPMWRSGPLGPRSLCNACGIRYRKRKMTDDQKPSCSEIKKEKFSTTTSTSKTVDDDDDQMNEESKMGFNHLGNQVIIPSASSSSLSSKLVRGENSRSSKSKRKLGEVEEAAVLLMSLSCGSVFA